MADEKSAIQPAVQPAPTDSVDRFVRFVQGLVDAGMGADEIGHIKTMYTDAVSDKAKTAFFAAMNKCQQKMQAVVKDARNDFNKSKYARLETIDNLIRPVYTEYGFSITFGTAEPLVEGKTKVYADIMHAEGHVIRTENYFSLDDKGSGGKTNKTEIQAEGSTLKYAQRYLTCLAFNVIVAEEDNDGVRSQGTALVSKDQVALLRAKIKECNDAGIPADETKLKNWQGVKELEDLKYLKWLEVINSLNARLSESSRGDNA